MKSLRHTSFNIHHIRLILACLFLPVFMVSCKKDTIEVTDLKFPLNTYYIPEGGETSIDIQRGNQKYLYNVADEKLIDVNISAMDWPAGNIQVKGLKKGSTQLTVKDAVTNQEVVLQIHVVDPYLAMRAIHLIPHIRGANNETDKAIRNKIKNDSKDFAAFKEGEILILRRNADHQFLVFKNEEDVARGIVYKSGNYTLNIAPSDPSKFSSKLTLKYADEEEIVELPISTGMSAFSILSDFSNEGRVGGQEFNPLDPYPHLYLIKDFTTYFQAIHPNVEQVELYQSMYIYQGSHHLSFGKEVLK